jgi:hypothetical protein
MGSVLSKGLDHSNRPMGTELLWVPHEVHDFSGGVA